MFGIAPACMPLRVHPILARMSLFALMVPAPHTYLSQTVTSCQPLLLLSIHVNRDTVLKFLNLGNQNYYTNSYKFLISEDA